MKDVATTKQAHGRIAALDGMRAIAALRVVVWHVTGWAVATWLVSAIPAMFFVTYPALAKLNFIGLTNPHSAVLAAVIFNALITGTVGVTVIVMGAPACKATPLESTAAWVIVMVPATVPVITAALAAEPKDAAVLPAGIVKLIVREPFVKRTSGLSALLVELNVRVSEPFTANG